MKVLIGCEYSGKVRDAFIKMGHDAISCDLLPSESFIGPHHQGDLYDMLNANWDLIIAHPPCTALTVAGNSTYGEGKDKHHLRLSSAAWTEELWNACKSVSDRVCFENPVGVLRRLAQSMPKPSYVQPYQHGHPETKKTALFLHGLRELTPTDDVYEYMMTLPVKERNRIHHMQPSKDRSKLRSETYHGIADAMAHQWGGWL